MIDRLCQSIRQNLESQGISISEKEIRNLYIATISGIYNLTEEGEIVDIPDFGSFWKRKTEEASVSLFTPDIRLNQCVNEDEQTNKHIEFK